MGKKVIKSCAICLNKAIGGESSAVAFHRFPKNIKIRQQWMDNCGFVRNVDCVDTLFICSSHFKISDYVNRASRKLKLKINALPSLFLPNKVVPLAVDNSIKRSVETDIDKPAISSAARLQGDRGSTDVKATSLKERLVSGEERYSTPKRQCLGYVDDISSPDHNSPKRSKRCVMLLKDTIMKKNMEIKRLQQQNRRLKMKIRSLNSLMENLKDRNFVSHEAEESIVVLIT